MKTSLRFCQKLEGNLTVAVTKATFILMNQTFAEVCGGEHYIYTGYTDREVEGEWRDVNTGDLITWTNWHKGQPNGGDKQQCCYINVVQGTMGDTSCTRRKCPICRVKHRSKLQLTGVCSQSEIDRFYIFKSQSELLGLTFTRMIFSSRSHRWEIVDRNEENKIFAFTNQSAVIPLGNHRWYFQNNDSCGDLELNLHSEVEKPGHFCCDDGSCIDSELVCNNFPDCQDGTDETNCSLLIQPSANYKNHLPSIGNDDGERNNLPINATFTVLKVVDINEDESFIDIFFKLHCLPPTALGHHQMIFFGELPVTRT